MIINHNCCIKLVPLVKFHLFVQSGGTYACCWLRSTLMAIIPYRVNLEVIPSYPLVLRRLLIALTSLLLSPTSGLFLQSFQTTISSGWAFHPLSAIFSPASSVTLPSQHCFLKSTNYDTYFSLCHPATL